MITSRSTSWKIPVNLSDPFSGYTDPFVALTADAAWRANESVNDGSKTTSLVSYIGNKTLTKDSAGQDIKRASLNFPGQSSILFDGVDASRGFSGVTLSSAPSNFTAVTVCRITTATSGTHSLSVGGTVNTGNCAGYDVSTTFSQKVTTAANKTQSLPLKLIILSVFDSNGISHYANSYTPVTAARAGSLAGTTFTIGVLDTAGTYTLGGEWVTTGYWLRALDFKEISLILKMLSIRNNITLSP